MCYLALCVLDTCACAHTVFLKGTRVWRENGIEESDRCRCIHCTKWVKIPKYSRLWETTKIFLMWNILVRKWSISVELFGTNYIDESCDRFLSKLSFQFLQFVRSLRHISGTEMLPSISFIGSYCVMRKDYVAPESSSRRGQQWKAKFEIFRVFKAHIGKHTGVTFIYKTRRENF